MKIETGDMMDSFPCDMEQYICLNPVGVQSLGTTADQLFSSSAFSPLSPMTMVSGSVSPGNGTLSPPPLMSSPPLWQTPTVPVWTRMNPQFVSGQLLSPPLSTNMTPLLPQEQNMLAIKFDMPSPVADVTPFSVASRLSPPAADQQSESALPYAVRNSASPAPSLRPQSESPMPDSVAPTPTPPSSTSSTPTPPNPQSNPATALKGKALRLATYNKWSQEEDLLLRHAVSIHGTVGKWSLVASMVPGRTPIQCSTRWLGALNPTIHKGKWASAEDATLLAAYAELTTDPEHPPWNKIAERIPGRTPVQCIARYQEALDPTVKKGKWCSEEDRLLRAGLEEYGKCWVKIASRIPGRTQRQCRTRWLQLRPKVDEVSRSESDSVGGSIGGTPEPGVLPSAEQSTETQSGGPKRNVRRAAVPCGVGSTVAAAAGGGSSKGRKRRENNAVDV
ncbi:Homeodomain-like protein [Cladochytrium replicatum]|nr:Homeodomain-like protein [Cladochytrium replicatum]